MLRQSNNLVSNFGRLVDRREANRNFFLRREAANTIASLFFLMENYPDEDWLAKAILDETYAEPADVKALVSWLQRLPSACKRELEWRRRNREDEGRRRS